MPSIRIAAAGAALLLLSGLTAGGAAAQTATDQTPGKPLQLLHWLHATSQPNNSKTKPHVKIAERKAVHTAAAATKHRRVRSEVAAATSPVSSRQAFNSATPAETTTAATPATMMAPTPQPALSRDQLVPKELVVAGRTVQVASPDEVNELDLAAKDTQPPASNAPSDAASLVPANEHVAEAGSKSASSTAPPPQPSTSKVTSQVGSASWIAKVLAALGGAVAAGSAAWFLIGATPQRTYG